MTKSLLLAALLIVIGGGAFLYNIFYGANDFDAPKKILYVSKGEQWEHVVDSLVARGVIRNRAWFNWVVQAYRKGTTPIVGKYEFKSGISNAAVYHSLIFGRNIVPINVVLKEGRRIHYYARAFHRTVGIDTMKFVTLATDPVFVHSLGIDANTLEGYLFPDTYAFHWQAREEEILKRLVHQTKKVFDDSLKARAKELKLTMHEALTLASIIEGEAFLDDERPIISGVYHNRLRKGMRLEADPTIQYIINDGPRRILHRDLEIKSPYNTYLNRGLPPGPICSPRLASILAALYPTAHQYYFFVANGRGGHWFARDFAAHSVNVQKFRRKRAAQIRSMKES